MKGFTLDVMASAEAGFDLYEGPIESRADISVFLEKHGTAEPVAYLDCPHRDIAEGNHIFELPLSQARQVADALIALLAHIDD